MLPLQRVALHRKPFQVGAEFCRGTMGRISRVRVVIPFASRDRLDMPSSAPTTDVSGNKLSAAEVLTCPTDQHRSALLAV